MDVSDRAWIVKRRLGAAVAASVAVHATAMSLSLPERRSPLSEVRRVLDVSLREVQPAIVPAPARSMPAAAPPEERVAPEPPRREPVAPARKRAVPAPPPAASVEETRAQASVPASQPEPDIVASAPQPAPPPQQAAVQVAPVPAPAPAELLASYGQTVSQALARHKEYPPLAQMQGWQGSVTMRLRVAPSGRLVAAEVHTSSGYDVLDRQALAMAARAGHFPAPPEALRDREIAVLVPVVFRFDR